VKQCDLNDVTYCSQLQYHSLGVRSMKGYVKIVNKPPNDFCQLLCALHIYSWSVHERFWILYGIFIFVCISQCSCVMCFIAVVQQHVWHNFIQTPSQKKKCDFFLKSEFLFTSTSSWEMPHDIEGDKILFHKVISYKSSRKRQF